MIGCANADSITSQMLSKYLKKKQQYEEMLADRMFYQAQIQKAQLNEFNLNEKLKDL